MKLRCVCDQDYAYCHTKAGQRFQCSWCKQWLVMPEFQSLSPEDQAFYRNELQKQQGKAQRAAEKAKRKEEAAATKEWTKQQRALELRAQEGERAAALQRQQERQQQPTPPQPTDQSSLVNCPKCGCAQISANKKGMDAGGACCGALLLGPLGILCGLQGANKVIVTCLKCGHQWTRG